MQIIQISDFHIKEDSNLVSIYGKIVRLYEGMVPYLSTTECTVICVLGDIVDGGKPLAYTNAISVFKHIRETFSAFNPHFVFTPGNHDLCCCPYVPNLPQICSDPKCTLDNYYEFLRQFNKDVNTESIYINHYDEIDILVVNSNYSNNCRYGLVDIAKLERTIFSKPALLLTHHTFLSENVNDASAIRNSYKLLEQIEKKEILGVLHGHTHGYKDMIIGKKCPVVGVGPFLKDIPNINNQANLIIATSTGIHRVINLFYRADLDKFESYSVYHRQSSVYYGSVVGKVYNNIVNDTKKFGVLFNLDINIETTYQNFADGIKHTFPEQIEIAKQWQQTTMIPDALYYNHGQYMQCRDIRALEFVINELNVKPTSSRAIIPLINFKDVIDSGDKFLPSFDIVQFGFTSDDRSHLVVTLYLRALEVNHFLKINLCEIYLMCKEIAATITSVRNISIHLYAFRAQYKERFGCFARAKIDRTAEADIAYLVRDNIPEIIKLLEEKRDLYETVIENCGMNRLHSALIAQNKFQKIKPRVLESIAETIEILYELELERKKSSNYPSIEATEKKLTDSINIVIGLLEGNIYQESVEN